MRTLFYFFLYVICISVPCQAQQNDAFTIHCVVPSENEIISSDTVFVSHANRIKVSHVGKKNKIISEEIITDTKNTFSFDFGNLNDASFSIVYYDTAGHIIYEAITENNIRFHCYSFKYNPKGQLIFKEGYSSGEQGVKITYEYDINGRLIKEMYQRPGGITIKSH